MSVKVMAQRINLPNAGERFCLRTARADSVTPKELLEYVSKRLGKYLSVGDNKLEIQLPSDMKAGTYSIRVSANLTGTKLRTGEMEEKFVVA